MVMWGLGAWCGRNGERSFAGGTVGREENLNRGKDEGDYKCAGIRSGSLAALRDDSALGFGEFWGSAKGDWGVAI
jgi:hypothetical protein